jgi:hypothetical protein
MPVKEARKVLLPVETEALSSTYTPKQLNSWLLLLLLLLLMPPLPPFPILTRPVILQQKIYYLHRNNSNHSSKRILQYVHVVTSTWTEVVSAAFSVT